ncbi:Orotidine 5'-phosphate decarboxylase [Dirofilaria immitis]
MISTTIVTVLLSLLYNFGCLTSSNARSYSVKQCYRELENGRKFLQQIKHELIIDDHKRQQQCIQALLIKQNSPAIFSFTANKIDAIIYLSNNNNIGMTLLINWINEMHNYLSNEKDSCEGPEFHNITTITMPQLQSFFALFLINHGLPLCSICDCMLRKVGSILFTTNSKKLTYAEEIFYELLLARIPNVKAICSGLIPACYHSYNKNVLPTTPAGKCIQCNICMAITTYFENYILLNQTAIYSINNWISEQYSYQVCSLAYQLFPPNFYWNEINYIHCVAWVQNFFDNFMNRLMTVIIAGNFCSARLHWCKSYEIPSIIDCLKEFCDESFPPPLQTTICDFLSNDSVDSSSFSEYQDVKR